MYGILSPERVKVRRAFSGVGRLFLQRVYFAGHMYGLHHVFFFASLFFLQSFKNTKALFSSDGHRDQVWTRLGCEPDLACKPEFANLWSTFMDNYDAETREHGNSFLYPTILMPSFAYVYCALMVGKGLHPHPD